MEIRKKVYIWHVIFNDAARIGKVKSYFVSEKKHSEFVVSPILIFSTSRRQRSETKVLYTADPSSMQAACRIWIK